MSLREILDSSIVETPPPFPDIDELIARERRRQRRLRWAAAVSGTAGVVGVVLGVALVTGNLGSARTPTDIGAGPSSSVTVPPDETPQQRYARLSELLRTRIAALLPEATITSMHPNSTELFGEDLLMMVPGYDFTAATVKVAAPQGSMDLSVLVVRPLAPPRPQPTTGVAGRLFGGCAGEWSTATPAVSGQDTCTDRAGPGGTAVSIAERHSEVGPSRLVTVAFPDGGVVTVITDPAATLLSPDELIEIVADPGFVAGRAAPPHEPAMVDPTDPFHPRDLPAEPEIDIVYPFDLYTHCGVDLVSFAGRTWRAEPPGIAALPGPYVAGTMQLLDHATARFVIDQRHVQTDREVILFYWAPDAEAPTCR